MKKLLVASASAIALFGLAACSDTDETTTQAVEPPAGQVQPVQPGTPSEPMATPPANSAPDAAPDTTAPSDTIRPVE